MLFVNVQNVRENDDSGEVFIPTRRWDLCFAMSVSHQQKMTPQSWQTALGQRPYSHGFLTLSPFICTVWKDTRSEKSSLAIWLQEISLQEFERYSLDLIWFEMIWVVWLIESLELEIFLSKKCASCKWFMKFPANTLLGQPLWPYLAGCFSYLVSQILVGNHRYKLDCDYHWPR